MWFVVGHQGQCPEAKLGIQFTRVAACIDASKALREAAPLRRSAAGLLDDARRCGASAPTRMQRVR